MEKENFKCTIAIQFSANSSPWTIYERRHRSGHFQNPNNNRLVENKNKIFFLIESKTFRKPFAT